MNEEFIKRIDKIQMQIKETQRKAQQVSLTLTKLHETLGKLRRN